MKVTENELTRFAKRVNDVSGWGWVGALFLSMILYPLLGFLGSWSFIPVIIILVVYFHYIDKWIVKSQVEKFVASKSSGEIQVDVKQ